MEGQELIATFKKQYAAHLAKDKLEQAGITTTILDHADPVSSVSGVYEVYVEIINADKAKEIIAEVNE